MIQSIQGFVYFWILLDLFLFISDEIKPNVDVEWTFVVLVIGALVVLNDDVGGAIKPLRSIPVDAQVVVAAIGIVGMFDQIHNYD